MSTPLEEELIKSAELHLMRVRRLAADGYDATELEAFATQLRQRAAWVRELEQLRPSPGLANMLSGFNDGFAYDLWSRFRGEFIACLTGPTPAAETAPTERKEP